MKKPIRVLALCGAALACGAGSGGAVAGYAPDRAAERAALTQIGAPWEWGGASPASGFDSSGLVVWAYAQQGIRLPHASAYLYTLRRARHIARADLRPGDLVFFNGAGHVGICVGDGRYVHAPQTGSSVRIDRLATRYYTGAVRVEPLRHTR
jgi:cell wall-associated NlpC family hydrolase